MGDLRCGELTCPQHGEANRAASAEKDAAHAEVLRRAALLMRKRALKAIPAPWVAEPLGSEGYAIFGPGINPHAASLRLRARRWVARIGMNDWHVDKDTAQYIASWSPAIALTIAEVLDHAAARAEAKLEHGGKPEYVWSHERHALTIASAYLGETDVLSPGGPDA